MKIKAKSETAISPVSKYLSDKCRSSETATLNAKKIADKLIDQAEGRQGRPGHPSSGRPWLDSLTREGVVIGPPLSDTENRSIYTTPVACSLTQDEWNAALDIIEPVAEFVLRDGPHRTSPEGSTDNIMKLQVEASESRFAIVAVADNLYLSDFSDEENPAKKYNFNKMGELLCAFCESSEWEVV